MISKKNILFIIGDASGGIRKHISSIITELPTNEYNVSLIYSSNNVDKWFEQNGADLLSLCEGFKSINIQKKIHWTDIVNFFYILNYARKNKFDIIHAHGAKAGFFGRTVGKLLRLKTIYTPHGGSLHNKKSKYSNYLYNNIEKFLYYFTDTFIFESYYSYNQYNKHIFKINDKKKFHINWNGITKKVTTKSSSFIIDGKTTTKIGFIGRLEAEKGFDIFLETLEILNSINFNFEAHIFGSGNYNINFISKNTLKKCIFHGDSPEVDAFITNLDLVIIPSRYESFGYVALEAIASGTIPISSRVGGLKEIFLNFDILSVKENNAKSIVNKILYINSLNEEEVLYLGEELISKLNKDFNIKKMITNLHSIYQTM